MPARSSGMDMNGKIAALLRDFAAIQKSKQSMWGYKRAAAAILALEEPIDSLLQPDGTLRKIPNIGPSSTRVILEVLQTGTSATVERAIAESGQATDIERRRDLRGHFLSRSQVLAAFRNEALVGPRVEDYHGDLQMHSTWSDGSQSLEDIITAGIERGYSFCGVTADWDRVFAAARKTNVAIEIDGDPSRQDVDYDLAKQAVDAGCLFALDSDAHSTGELRYAETAIAHARLAGVPTERVVNCWETDRLLDWLRSRSG